MNPLLEDFTSRDLLEEILFRGIHLQDIVTLVVPGATQEECLRVARIFDKKPGE